MQKELGRQVPELGRKAVARFQCSTALDKSGRVQSTVRLGGHAGLPHGLGDARLTTVLALTTFSAIISDKGTS